MNAGLMSTGQLLLFAASIACLSSVLTVALVALVVRIWIRPRFRAHIESASDTVAAKVRVAVAEAGEELLPKFEASVRAGFEQSAEQLLPRFREEVKGGFSEAADEVVPQLKQEVGDGVEAGVIRVLPQVRQEVTEGVKDGLIGVIDPEVVARAGENVAKAGSSVIEKGLNLFFGRKEEDS